MNKRDNYLEFDLKKGEAMKTIICKISILCIFLFVFISGYGATKKTSEYKLELTDTTTFKKNGGSVNPAQWEMKNDSVYLQTCELEVDETPVAITIRLNLSGNLEDNDKAYIMYSIDGGEFYVDSMIRGSDHSSVFNFDDVLDLAPGQTLTVRISAKSNDNNEKWQVKNGNISTSVVLMPVELASFNATYETPNVLVEWSTATELNNQYFDVEKSTNGVSFEQVAKINGAGNSSSYLEYSCKDYNIQEGTVYYRLLQIDYDGKSKYFDVVAVDVPRGNEVKCELSVNPNPCMGKCNCEMNNCEGENINEIQIAVFDALGNLTYSSTPQNMDNGQMKFQYDVQNNIKPGVYIVRGSSGSKTYTKKVFINKG